MNLPKLFYKNSYVYIEKRKKEKEDMIAIKSELLCKIICK